MPKRTATQALSTSTNSLRQQTTPPTLRFSNRLHAKRYHATRAASQIKTIQHLREIVPLISAHTLVVTDLDNTLIEPVQLLGSDQWFEAHLAREVNSGHTFQIALQQTLNIYHPVHERTVVKAIEEDTVAIINSLQDTGTQVLALTTRGKQIADATIRQVNSIGLCFNKDKFADFNIELNLGKDSIAKSGIIFAGGKHKGQALLEYLSHLQVKPQSILFIDDKMKNVLEVEDVAKTLGIVYTGIRYSHVDYKINQVHLPIADIQWQAMQTIISDTEATARLNKESTRNNFRL